MPIFDRAPHMKAHDIELLAGAILSCCVYYSMIRGVVLIIKNHVA